MPSLFTRLRDTLMSIIAAISRRQGSGTGGGGGGGQPVPPYLASTTLAGDSTGIVTHQTTPYVLTQYDQFGALFAGSPGPFTYQSSNPSVATIDSTGKATGIAAGTTNITCRVTNSLGTVITSSPPVTLTVSAQVATNVTVAPPSAAILVAGTQQFTAVVKDQASVPNVISGATGAWDTSDHSKATVNGSGLATGVADTAGTPVNVTFTSGSASGSGALIVTAVVSGVTAVTAYYNNQSAPSLIFSDASPALVAKDQSANVLTAQGTWASSDATNAPINSSTGAITVNGMCAATFTYTHTTTGLQATITATVLKAPAAWLVRETVPYLNDAAFRANIKTSVNNNGLATPPATGGASSLYIDGISAGAISLDATNKFNGNQTLRQKFNSGIVPQLSATIPGNTGRLWTICVKRYDNGFNTFFGGTIPPAASYKDGPYLSGGASAGRTGHLYTNATQIGAECTVQNGGTIVGGASETIIQGNVGSIWTNQLWLIDIQLYEIPTGTIISRRAWRCVTGTNPISSNLVSNQQVGGAVQNGFPSPIRSLIQPIGDNFNRDTTIPTAGIFKNVAYWGVIDGAIYPDPFGLFPAEPTPTLTGISGGTIQPGATSQTITLTGTNFNVNCYPIFSNSGIRAHYSGDKISNLTVTATTITFVVDCVSTATPTIGTVSVYNGMSGVSTGTQTVTVGSVTPPGAPTAANATVVNNQTVTFPVTLNASGSLPDSLAWKYSTDNVSFTAGTDLPLTSPTLGATVQQQVTLPAASTLYYVQFAEKNSAGTSSYTASVTGTTGATAGLPTSGLVLDLNADLGLDTTTDGAGVGSWTDQTATAATLFQGTAAKKPILRKNKYGTHAALEFVSANSANITANAIISALNTADSTIIIVGASSVSNPVNDGRWWANLDSGNKQGYLVKMVRTTNTCAVQYADGSSFPIINLSTTMSAASGLHAFGCAFNHSTPTELTTFDGTTPTTGTGAYSYPVASPVFVSVGSSTGSANFLDGFVTRIFQWNRALSAAELAQVYSYLKAQGYGLP